MNITSVRVAGFHLDLVEEKPLGTWLDSFLASEAVPGPVVLESANLDHVRWFPNGSHTGTDQEWLNLLDGAPLALFARLLTKRRWPRLTGADLLEPILKMCAANDRSVGFLGGMPSMHTALRAKLARDMPNLRVAGCWAPDRMDLTQPEKAAALAAEARAVRTDVLVVALGKPRQEEWIMAHGSASGARLLLAFGAAPDFYAGTVPRAPMVLRRSGLEWAYRLATQPRRLGRRYLVEGPQSIARVLRGWRSSQTAGIRSRTI